MATAPSSWRRSASAAANASGRGDALDSSRRALRLSAVHEQQQQQQQRHVRKHNDADEQLARQLREGLLRKSSSLRYPPPRTTTTTTSLARTMSAAHSSLCNAIDVADSDVESDDDWVASDYQGSEVASSSARESMTLVSNDGGVIREDEPYIISSTRRTGSRTHEPLVLTQKPHAHTQRPRRHKRPHAPSYLDSGDALGERKSVADDSDWLAQSHVTLFSRKHVGLLVSLAFASMLTSSLKRGVLPLMQAEIAMQAYQVDATKILLMLPWSCGLLVGFVSDVFPLWGSHRKAYMMLGWVVTALALFAMVLLNNSFNVNGTLLSTSSMDAGRRNAIVGGYIALLGLACFGEIASVIVAEVYVVALSQREVIKRRGFVIGTFLLTQFFFEGVGQVATDQVVFQFTPAGKMQPFYSLQDVLTFLVCYALVPIPVLYYFFDDHLESTGGRIGECELLEDDSDDDDDDAREKAAGATVKTRFRACGRRVHRHWLQLWATLEQKATWHVVCFLCLFIFFTEFTLKYPFTVLDKWAGVTAKTTSTGKIFTELMYFLSALLWLVAFRRRNWNYFVVVSYLGAFVFPSMAYYLACAFSGMGPMELYMFMGSLHGFVRGIAIILEVAMTVEIARRGAEGALLGAIVSMASIIRLVSETFSNSIGWLFGTQFLSQDTGTTTKDEPMLVATALILCYTIRLLALVGVLFLPSQKIMLLRLRFVGGRKPRRAWWTLGILVFSMLTASIVNTLVITPDTMCLPVFGGKGCGK